MYIVPYRHGSFMYIVPYRHWQSGRVLNHIVVSCWKTKTAMLCLRAADRAPRYSNKNILVRNLRRNSLSAHSVSLRGDLPVIVGQF